jgi:hypothetical protein
VLDARSYNSRPRTTAESGKNFNGGFLLENHNHAMLSGSVETLVSPTGTGNRLAKAFFEVWDYVGGSSFRGFIAERPGAKSMFVFFARDSFQSNLKAG